MITDKYDTYGYIHAKKANSNDITSRYSTNAGARPEILYNSPVIPDP